MGIKYRMLDMAGLEKLKDSRPEEPCPFFIQPHARRRRRKRSSEGQAEMDHHDEGHGEGKSTVYNIRTVRPLLLFTFGTFESFLAGLGRNCVYGAC